VFDKLGRIEVEEATAGDIAAIVGLETVEIGDTIADPQQPSALPRLTVDPPGSPLGRPRANYHTRDEAPKECPDASQRVCGG